MRHISNNPLISTIKERCRICYTCVRECPAKAIRIADGQAEIIPERCIGCGNCVRVCSQNAKRVIDSKEKVYELLKSEHKSIAIIAPSFPADFMEFDFKTLVGMIRKLGFDYVSEVGFGADLVAREYKELLENSAPDCKYIATSCPAIITYVERYHPDLVGNLVPIVSPMVAMARALRSIYSKDIKIVFIGPCIAKKGEIASINMPDELEEALTFTELREMFSEENISQDKVALSDFDPPYAGIGAIFPIGKGLLQAAELKEDLVTNEVIAVEGGNNFVGAFKEFETGDMDVRLLEVLACDGCIMGPGISNEKPLFNRRSSVSQYVKGKMETLDKSGWQGQMDSFESLDLTRKFAAFDQRIKIIVSDELEQVLQKMGKFKPEDELNCGACGYNTCREHAVAILKGLAESEMCLPFTIEKLHKTIDDLGFSNRQLANTQEALLQSEKLASMGQLAAGIAHEVNNPLGVVLMYAHLLLDKHKNDENLKDDLGLIAEQADRCKKIVGGLLNFARRNKVLPQPIDVFEFIDNVVKAIPNEKNVKIEIKNKLQDNTVEIDRDQITQVLTNLITNAFAATYLDGKIIIDIAGDKNKVSLKVTDNGFGIPVENMPRIFEPFFTTKNIGKGTGLGLAVTYGIVKMHRGDITVQSNADPKKGPRGTTFTVTLPRKYNDSF
ncbi:MAG: 4Fe-4S binding protein [Anaerohalosphaeraceae bacterium]|nr:4Fe-4S binding protein [Anaerohalosphaeraceae bacterium]